MDELCDLQKQNTNTARHSMSMEYGLGEQFGCEDKDPMMRVGSSVVPMGALFRKIFFDGPSADKLSALGGVFQGEIAKRMIASARERCLVIERQTKKGNVLNKQQMIQEEAKGLASAELEALKGDIELCADEGSKHSIMVECQKLLKAWSKEEFSNDILERAKSKVELKTAGQDTRPEAERKWEVVRCLFYCLLYHSENMGFSKEVTGRVPKEIDYWTEASRVLNGLSNAALCLQRREGEKAAPFATRLHRALQTIEWISWALCPIATPRQEGTEGEMQESQTSVEEQAKKVEKEAFVESIIANVREALTEKAVAAIPPAEGWIQATVLVKCGHKRELLLQQLVAYYQSQSERITQHTIHKLNKPISNNHRGRPVAEWQLRKEQNTSVVEYAMDDKAQPGEEAEGEEPEGKEVEVRKLQQMLSQEIQKQHQALRSEMQELFNQASPSKLQEPQQFGVNALQPAPLPTVGLPPGLHHPCGLHMLGKCTAGLACPLNHVLADTAREIGRRRSRSPRRRSRSPDRDRRRRSVSPESDRSRNQYSWSQGGYDPKTWFRIHSGGKGRYGKGKGGGYRAGGKGKGGCFGFQRGDCWYGESCRFSHETGKRHEEEKNERGRGAVPRSSEKRR